ncbi:hypothetical protein CC86DRAFT_401175 [Ophiobolus disseminans]|uniref:Ecp2 effector protein domain-containing protein n=1 Tax=Ophiobolus disseminans TaxID=1469910 RepID=A0A6A7AGH6_9PLEO|nr:hypothetical protein CC86DRAFT_401175 [Ophiobolus disseminans]
MLSSYSHLLSILALFVVFVIASPVDFSRFEWLSIDSRKGNRQPRNGPASSLQLPDWPFPANKSDVENVEPRPNDIPPTWSPDSDGEVRASGKQSKAFIEKSCSPAQKEIVLAAWEEARLLKQAQTERRIGYLFNIPHEQWLGKDWNTGSHGAKILGNGYKTAPKDSTADGSTPVKVAIQDFCKNRNGQKIATRGDRIYDRWDVSGLSIMKRGSFWLSATTSPSEEYSQGAIEEKDCVAVLSGAMKSCDKDRPDTSGALAKGTGCIEYAIDISSSVHNGDPPWHQHVKKFPPPENIRSDLAPAASVDSQIVCGKERGSQWTAEDADAAIEAHCGNDNA